MNEKAQANKLRRTAQRDGYRLEKSRLRDPSAVGFGGYMLMDASRNLVVLGGAGLNGFDYSASLADVEAFFA